MFYYKFFFHKQSGYVRVKITTNTGTSCQVSLRIPCTEDAFDMAVNTTFRSKIVSPVRDGIKRYTACLEAIRQQLVDEDYTDAPAESVKYRLYKLIGREFKPRDYSPIKKSPLIAVNEQRKARRKARLNKGTFGPFVTHYLKFAKSHTNANTIDRYLLTLKKMRQFDVRVDRFMFEDVTFAWLTEFESFLVSQSLKGNSRSIHHRNIRAVIKNANAYELTKAHPYDLFKIKSEPTRHRCLGLGMLRKVLGYHSDKDPMVEMAADLFRLTFMLIGINMIDLCYVEELINGRIVYSRAKTNRQYSVKVEPEAMAIIDKYRGDKYLLGFVEKYKNNNYRIFNHTMGSAYKRMCRELGLAELSLYWARHSWATIASEIDIPMDTIAACLGHGNIGRSVTSIYVKISDKRVDKANRAVLDYVLYGREPE